MIDGRLLIDIIILISALVPSLILLKLYFKYQIIDYMIFSITFFIVVIDVFINLLLVANQKLVFFQLQHFFINVGMFFFFLHIINMRGDLRSSKIGKFTLGFLILISVSIISWQPIYAHPDTITLFNVKIPSSGTALYHPNGAGLTIDGQIIHSTSYPILTDIFLLLITISFLVSYFTVVPINKTKEIDHSIILWRVVGVCLVLYSTLRLPWIGLEDQQIAPLLVIGLIIAMVISIIYPQAHIISYAQVYRIYGLVDKVKNMEKSKAIDEYENEGLVDYLSEIGKIFKSANSSSNEF